MIATGSVPWHFFAATGQAGDRSGKPSARPQPAESTGVRKTVDTESLLTGAERQRRRAAAGPPAAGAPGSAAPTFGFKKGFLTAARPRVTPKGEVRSAPAGDKEIETVRPLQARDESLRFRDVQDAMRESGPAGLLNEAIMSEDFVSRVVNNPALTKAMKSPEFRAALEMFAKDPKRALAKFGSRPDIIGPLREYSGLLGNRLGELDRVPAELPDGLQPHEQELVKVRVLADPEAKSALRDPKFAAIFAEILKNPQTASSVDGAPVMPVKIPFQKLRKLMEVGLLQLQSAQKSEREIDESKPSVHNIGMTHAIHFQTRFLQDHSYGEKSLQDRFYGE
ncbi:MAG: hypothetical protein BJ554DRAFT_4889, partial [Olpidium bornovanus]